MRLLAAFIKHGVYWLVASVSLAAGVVGSLCGEDPSSNYMCAIAWTAFYAVFVKEWK